VEVAPLHAEDRSPHDLEHEVAGEGVAPFLALAVRRNEPVPHEVLDERARIVEPRGLGEECRREGRPDGRRDLERAPAREIECVDPRRDERVEPGGRPGSRSGATIRATSPSRTIRPSPWSAFTTASM
jgi:hypothetical protein